MIKRIRKCSQRGGSQRDVRRTFKMLREVWMNIGVKKLDTHKGITIKALFNSGATGGEHILQRLYKKNKNGCMRSREDRGNFRDTMVGSA